MTAIARKIACDPYGLTSGMIPESWRRAYGDFVGRLTATTFGSILFDYDDTLCDGRDRFTGLRDGTAAALRRILAAGIPFGIATGRGRSVREELRKVLAEATWDRVLVGYYNGTDIAKLRDDAHPATSSSPNGSLDAAGEVLSRHPIIAALAIVDVRPTQVSLQPKSAAFGDLVLRVAFDLIQAHGDLKIVRSSHSIDVLKHTASKRALLNALGEMAAPKPVLCIGDMGRWPGNDYDILASEYSLSVDEVSTATNSCWNLAPAGFRGAQATMHYLGALNLARGSFTLDITKLSSRGTTRTRS